MTPSCRGRLRLPHMLLAFVVPVCYGLIGLCCIWHDFSWYGTIAFGIAHVVGALGMYRTAQAPYNPIQSFVRFVLMGVLTFLAVSFGGLPAVNHGFPFALVGSVAWSIVSWQSMACLTLMHGGEAAVGRVDPILILAVPIVVAAMLGGIFAITNTDSHLPAERIEDFWSVAKLGVACGVFLSIPWFCLRLLGNKLSSGGD